MDMSVTSSDRRHRERAGILFAALLALTSGYGGDVRAQAASRALVLLTPDEASQLTFSQGEWPPKLRPRGLTTGPRVVIEQPHLSGAAGKEQIDLKTPARLVVRFEENQAPVDMGSLEVSARKGFFTKSLTGLLKPYVRGTTLHVDELEVPAGQFLVEIQIADTKGVQTLESYRLQVTAP